MWKVYQALFLVGKYTFVAIIGCAIAISHPTHSLDRDIYVTLVKCHFEMFLSKLAIYKYGANQRPPSFFPSLK